MAIRIMEMDEIPHALLKIVGHALVDQQPLRTFALIYVGMGLLSNQEETITATMETQYLEMAVMKVVI